MATVNTMGIFRCVRFWMLFLCEQHLVLALWLLGVSCDLSEVLLPFENAKCSCRSLRASLFPDHHLRQGLLKPQALRVEGQESIPLFYVSVCVCMCVCVCVCVCV